MTKQIYGFMNCLDEVSNLSEEIVQKFIDEATTQNVEYNFELAKGTGKVKHRAPNTSFCFDAKAGNSLDNFKQALFSEDLDHIEKDSEEEKELTDKVNEFLGLVAQNINDNYVDDLRGVLRNVVLPDSEEESIPLTEIVVTSIDVTNYDSVPEPYKYLMKVGHAPEIYVDTPEIIKYVQGVEEETGLTCQEIFNTEKNMNPLFKDVLAISRGERYLYDITVTMFVDYSLSELPENPTL